MEEMMEEYVTFHVTAKDGSDVEMAVVLIYVHNYPANAGYAESPEPAVLPYRSHCME